MQALRNAASRLLASLRAAGALSSVITLLGLVGAALVIVSEFLTIFAVDVLTSGTCEEISDPAARDACHSSGFEQHGGAFILLGVLALVMALGAGRGRSRPAAVALVVTGAIVLGFAFLRDLPKTDDTGLVGIQYDEAKAGPGPGFYIEIAGGVVCVVAGALGLATAGRGSDPEPSARPRSRPRREPA
ncbi:MAG: hypothetical protein ACR2HC_07905 [Thermoleophilaceae bacterium]